MRTHVLTHGALSESLLQKSPTTHDRKGREGKGTGNRKRVACDSIHRHSVKAARADAWMAADAADGGDWR